MHRLSPIYTVHRALRTARAPVSRERLRELLEGCSQSSLTRLIREMRDVLRAPIEYDHEYRGYRYSADGSESFELPGLWFNPSELHALLSCQQLLEGVQPGLLDEHLRPLKSRIQQILRAHRLKPAEVSRRVRIIAIAQRTPVARVFSPLASALLQRRQVQIEYHARTTDVKTDRVVSPQRLVHYRDNWYLDAWDHGQDDVRTFSVDRILDVRPRKLPAKELEDGRLDTHFKSGYGIFSGPARQIAVLRFSAGRARWVADEQWHVDQQGRWLSDGSYELSLPYSNSRELLLDIMRYGADVEVMAPPELRQEVSGSLQAAAAIYLKR